MSVRRRSWRDPKGRVQNAWVVDIVFTHPNGAKKRTTIVSPVQTRRGAEQHERAVRAELAAGTYGKRKEPPPTLAQYASDFLEKYARPENKPSVYTEKERIIRVHLKPRLGAKRLDEIRQKEIAEFKAAQALIVGPKTLNNQLAVLRRMLRVAVDWELLDSAPAIADVEAAPPEIVVLDWATEVPALLAQLGEPWRTMAMTALHAGLRSGELRALQLGDIVNGRGTVRRNLWRGRNTTPKHGKTRTVPFNSELRAALEALPRRGLWVFCNPDGTQLGDQQGDSQLEHACAAAGIRRVGWHALRHTFATRLVSNGVELPVVQKLLGHASIKTTMRYLHFAPARHDAAVESLTSTRDIQATRDVEAGKKTSN